MSRTDLLSPLVFHECINLHFCSFNLNRSRYQLDQNANLDDHSYFKYHAFPFPMICSLRTVLSLSLSTISTVDDNGSETRYRKTVLDRYVSMAADNIPFLSPSISETLLSLSVCVCISESRNRMLFRN